LQIVTKFEQYQRIAPGLGSSLTIQKELSTRHWLMSWFGLTHTSILIAGILAVAAVRATPAVAETLGTSAKSFFLVASSDMPDPVFQKSVILMLPPQEPPLVAGVIINKPTDVTLGKILRPPLTPESQNQRVYFGGPVDLSTPLLVIRTTTPPKAAFRLLSNVFAIADPSSIRDLLSGTRHGGDARLFLGRAQWVQEQLRGELLQGAWSVVPLRADLLFDHDSGKVWPMLSQHEHVREVDSHTCATNTLTVSMCSAGIAW
jgi:putative AlgH/UPF0301 family transcriptional regulator